MPAPPVEPVVVAEGKQRRGRRPRKTGESATIEAAAAEAPRVEIAVAEEKPVKAKRSPRTRKPKAGSSGD